MGAAIGYGLAIPVSKLNADVRLAEQVRLEETGQVEGTIDATEAFYNTGRPREELYAEVIELRAGYNVVGILLGAWVGFVIGAKLLHLGIRRRRTEYLPEPLDCVSCGRCFWYCPNEQLRLGLIEDVSEMVPAGSPGGVDPALTVIQ
jgi:NosR/NirI family nitrous oxide reductase transcriptional regulator